MPLYSIFEQRETHWIVRESDPSEIAFPNSSPFANWSVFNPLVPLPDGFGGRPHYSPAGDGHCFVSTPRIDFRTALEDGVAASAHAARLLRWLQHVSGQIGLGTRLVGYQFYPEGSEGTPARAPFSFRPTTALMHHVRAGALTFDRIRATIGRRFCIRRLRSRRWRRLELMRCTKRPGAKRLPTFELSRRH
jgi:hypothetical protein